MSLLHTFPHPQLNLVPQSSQLQDRVRKSTKNTLMKQLAWSCSFHQRDESRTLSLTSSSLVRSNSRPLSLNRATWWGPSLKVTYTRNKNLWNSGQRVIKLYSENSDITTLKTQNYFLFLDMLWQSIPLNKGSINMDVNHLHKHEAHWPHTPWQESVSSSLLSPWERSWPALSSQARWSSQHSDPRPQRPEAGRGWDHGSSTQ